MCASFSIPYFLAYHGERSWLVGAVGRRDLADYYPSCCGGPRSPHPPASSSSCAWPRCASLTGAAARAPRTRLAALTRACGGAKMCRKCRRRTLRAPLVSRAPSSTRLPLRLHFSHFFLVPLTLRLKLNLSHELLGLVHTNFGDIGVTPRRSLAYSGACSSRGPRGWRSSPSSSGPCAHISRARRCFLAAFIAS